MTTPDDSLDRARQDADLSQDELWIRYFGLGGMAPAMELEAVCHGAMRTDGPDHDRIAHALNTLHRTRTQPPRPVLPRPR